MDKEMAELIKKNKGNLRQLTDLNNRVKKLEEINRPYPNEAELARMHLREGTD